MLSTIGTKASKPDTSAPERKARDGLSRSVRGAATTAFRHRPDPAQRAGHGDTLMPGMPVADHVRWSPPPNTPSMPHLDLPTVDSLRQSAKIRAPPLLERDFLRKCSPDCPQVWSVMEKYRGTFSTFHTTLKKCQKIFMPALPSIGWYWQ
jgi:hypothetical protein